MNNKDFIDFTTQVFETCKGIMDTKGPDYSGLEDRLANFKEAAERLGITPYQDLAALAHKHDKAVEAFIRGEKLTGEPIQQKLYDRINYNVLLLALIKDLNEKL